MELTFANLSSFLCSPVPQSVDFHLDKILINVFCARTLSLKFIAINFTSTTAQEEGCWNVCTDMWGLYVVEK